MTEPRERFAQLVRRLGARGEPGAAAEAVLAAYAGPERAYHGLAHLVDCLARLDQVSIPGSDRDRAEAALWYHDAVYDPRAGDNEERSAALARQALSDLGVPNPVAEDVARLVRLTDHRTPASDATGRLVCDIDLSILGRPRTEFDAYEAAIRAEYAWVPDEAYRAGRRQVLSSLLARDPLYGTDQFRRRYEASARSNLRRALVRIEGRRT